MGIILLNAPDGKQAQMPVYQVPPAPRTGPGAYTAAVLAGILRRYAAARLPAPVRIYHPTFPREFPWRLFATEWAGRWLGFTQPPGQKFDGVPLPLVSAEAGPSDIDGVWDFSAEFGLLFFVTTGHLMLDPGEHFLRCTHGVMAGRNADVSGFVRWVEEQGRLAAVAQRQIVNLHGCYGTQQDQRPVTVATEEVLLPGAVRDDLLRAVDLFCEGEEWYRDQGLAWRRGVLLYGPPGNGKTLVARMLASRFLDRGAAVYAYTPCDGCDNGALRRAFVQASVQAPALLILEDVDGLAETRITRDGLLSLLDGSVGGVRGVFLVATTNYPEAVDPALVGRTGRFDHAIELPAPTAGQRATYLGGWWQPGDARHALIDAAVAATNGLSFAALNEIRYWAAMRLRDGQPLVGDALEEYVVALRRAEGARRDRFWARGRLGFAAAGAAGAGGVEGSSPPSL